MLALLRDDSAQGLLEYALIVTFVAVVAVVALKAVAAKVVVPLNTAGNAL